MATQVDPKTDALGDDDESVHPSREPLQTPGTKEKFFTMEMEEELYEENRKLHTFTKTRQLLASATPGIAMYHEKVSLFDEMADNPDTETGGSHYMSTRTSNATAHNASRTTLYKMAYINLNDDLKAESKRNLSTCRKEHREGELLCADTSMVEGHTKEGLAACGGDILKNKGDSVKFPKDATILKFPSGNQSDEDNTVISKLDAEKCIIIQLSEEISWKLLLLASALENTDNIKKMSDSNSRNASLTVQNS
jgi:hypothetical protein